MRKNREKYIDAPGQIQTLWRTLLFTENVWPHANCATAIVNCKSFGALNVS
jgi:hypothetical protein